MSKPTAHAWTHGMTTVPTLLAECCCGVQRHEVDGQPEGSVIWYLSTETGEYTRQAPDCMRGNDEKESRETIAQRIKDNHRRGPGARGDDKEMRTR